MSTVDYGCTECRADIDQAMQITHKQERDQALENALIEHIRKGAALENPNVAACNPCWRYLVVRTGRINREGKWKIEGYDTFDEGDAFYPLPGEFETEEMAREAAAERLKELEQSQPSSSSGGQDIFGIQDHVYVVRPDGSHYRFTG